MFFSKSFGYALRGILYVAIMSDEKRKIRIDEMAGRLGVPRHFLGKIMNKVAKQGILSSTKGPNGGFTLNDGTLTTPLLTLLEAMDGKGQFEACVLRLGKCTDEHPCPLDRLLQPHRERLQDLFSTTKLGDLLGEEKSLFIRSISAA